MVEAFFDGVCEPRNPGGHGAWGALVKVDGQVLYAEGGYVGVGPTVSNNVAEYSGFIAAVEWMLEHNVHGVVIIRGDSNLVIKQLSGKWRIHGGLYRPFHDRAKVLLADLNKQVGGNVALEWMPREKNSECDRLSKKVLLDRGVKFSIQPMEAQHT